MIKNGPPYKSKKAFFTVKNWGYRLKTFSFLLDLIYLRVLNRLFLIGNFTLNC